MIAHLILSLLLSACLPSTQGRTPFHLGSHRLLLEEASEEVFSLPSGAVAGRPSPLLNAPHGAGWVTVSAPRSGSPHADDKQPLETRVFDGIVDTDEKVFPYAAYLEWDVDGQVGACSGALIAPGWVVTAAQCVSWEGYAADPSELTVWVAGEWYDAAAVHVHSGYDEGTGPLTQPMNDIGLVQLAQTSNVRTVALPDAELNLPVGSTVWAAGWGVESGEASEVLRYTDLTTFGETDQAHCPAKGFTDNFCAGGTSGYTCGADVGGPVVLPTETGDVLVGLTSWGPEDCRQPYRFYVRVKAHRDWLSATMSGNGTSSSVLWDISG